MKNTKKIISLLLSILMIITSIPLMAVNSFAADEIASGDYTYVVLDDGTAEITKYTGSAAELTIPSEIDGYRVTSIGYQAFYNCKSLTNITIPDSVTSIGDGAFEGCTSLTSITIPDSVTSIGGYAFGDTAYYNDESNWDNGILYIGNHLIRAKSDISGSVEIKQGTKTIAVGAFSGCTSLTNITFTDSVISIGRTAFYNCTLLVSITIPDSVTSIGNSAFNDCTSLTSITIPGSVESIGDHAFYDCTSLESVIIENGVKSIGNNAFEGCTSLTSITIPDSVTNIGKYAIWLTAYIKDKSNWENGIVYIGNHLIYGEGLSEDIKIRQGTKTIADGAFGNYSNASLASITVPKSVVYIGEKALGYNLQSGDEKKNDGLIIYGFVDSEAEKYAKGNGFEFEYIESESLDVSQAPAKTTYFVGDTLDTTGLKLTLTYNNGDTETVTSGYTVSGFNSSTVGTKTITVSYNGKTATFNVEVIKPSITLSNNSLSFDSIGSTKVLTATTAPSDQNITWTSSNTSVATVSNGVVTAKGEGTATITAKFTYNGIAYSTTCNVTVKVPVVLSSVSVSKMPTKSIYYIGDTFNAAGLELLLVYSNGTTKTVTTGYTVSGFNSKTAGANTITVAYNGKTATFNVEVVKPSITLSNSNLSFDSIGSAKTLTATTAPSNQNITWTSSNTSVATVSNGVVTATGGGITTITATFYYNGVAYASKCTVSVETPVELFSVHVVKSPNKTVYYTGDAFNTAGLELLLVYSDGTTKTITTGYTVSGFSSKTAGIKTITTSYNGKTATFNVEVVEPSITLSNNILSFDSIGSTKVLTATTTPSNQNVTWTSSNASVATVSNGVVTAKGDGNATITAKFTYNNIEYTATCNVTVRVLTVPTVTFPDVSEAAWYYPAIAFNVNKGYLKGYGNGNFGPGDNIQRQDFVVLLSRIAGVDLSAYEGQNGGFADVPTDTYFSAAVAWAKDNNILSGYANGKFGVGDPITREQACKIFYNYCDGSVSGNTATILANYPDGNVVSDWAREYVAWAAENHVVGGNGTLNPAGNANRAEMAQIIMNMSNNDIL